MKNSSVLLFDEEVESLDLLNFYLSKYCKEITEVYKTTNTTEAIELYLEHRPSVLFLNVSLKNQGKLFSMLKKIDTLENDVVFISSHKKYAFKAIANNAVAYLIKPLQINELVEATNKALLNNSNKQKIQEYEKINTKEYSKKSNIIAVPSISTIDLVNVDDLLYLEADGRYTVFYMKNGTKKTSSRNLGDYEKQLNTDVFFRIHHKYLININSMVLINKRAGNYCQLENGKELPIAKRRQDLLYRFLKIK